MQKKVFTPQEFKLLLEDIRQGNRSNADKRAREAGYSDADSLLRRIKAMVPVIPEDLNKAVESLDHVREAYPGLAEIFALDTVNHDKEILLDLLRDDPVGAVLSYGQKGDIGKQELSEEQKELADRKEAKRLGVRYDRYLRLKEVKKLLDAYRTYEEIAEVLSVSIDTIKGDKQVLKKGGLI